MHRRTAIRNAIEAALDAISGGPTVLVNRTRPIDDGDLPVIELKTPTDEIVRFDKNGENDRRLSVVVTVYGSGDAAYDKVDAWAGDVETAVYGSAALAALIVDLQLDRTDIEETDQGESVFVTATLAFTVRYATGEDDPT